MGSLNNLGWCAGGGWGERLGLPFYLALPDWSPSHLIFLTILMHHGTETPLSKEWQIPMKTLPYLHTWSVIINPLTFRPRPPRTIPSFLEWGSRGPTNVGRGDGVSNQWGWGRGRNEGGGKGGVRGWVFHSIWSFLASLSLWSPSHLIGTLPSKEWQTLVKTTPYLTRTWSVIIF